MIRKRRPAPQQVEPRLPGEIIAEVASHISTTWDILNMCLMSKPLFTLLLPALYASMDMKTVKRCVECIDHLIAQPNRARYVRSLILRPRGYRLVNEPSAASYSDDRAIARALKLLIPHLQALRRFEWHGLDLPDDTVWSALRYHCPKLRYIGAGLWDINNAHLESEIFRFEGLLGFSLSFISRSFADTTFLPLPPLLIDMLTKRCPDLEELNLSSPPIGSTKKLGTFYDGMALLHGRWPNLHTLNLETLFFYNTRFTFPGINTRKKQVAALFSAHPHLRNVAVHEEYLLPTGMQLTAFRGSIRYNSTSYSGDIFQKLQSLDLSGTPGDGQAILHLPSIVKSLPELLSLAFSINLERDYHVECPDGFFRIFRPFEHIRAVVQSVPQLQELRLMCRALSTANFSLEFFPDILDGSALKSFELWRSLDHYHIRKHDCAVTPTAVRLARAYPSLEFMSFRMIKDRGWLYWQNNRLEVIRDSAYSVVHSAGGEPVQLIVQDRVPDPARRSRNDRYILDLRPKVGVLSKWKRALGSGLGGSDEKDRQ